MSRKDLDIYETRLNVATRAKFCCEVCGVSLPLDKGELAHRIPQRAHLIEKFTPAVIHHNMNFKWTCPGACNSAVSIGGSPAEQERLADAIRMRILEDVSIRIHCSPMLYKKLIIQLAKVASGEGAS